jgi:biotin carboxylase
MNVVLLSPHFPPNYYQFAVALRRLDVNVLGIGDCPYDALRPELQEALTEYYRLDTMHNYDRVLRACAYLTFRHGKIDGLESHNEYWLETDARLRTDFNIPGLHLADLERVKHKFIMKQIFAQAGVEVAPGGLVRTREEARRIVAEVGYPVIAKPDVGVGAMATYKIRDDEELERFFFEKPAVNYVIETFVPGPLYSFDGLTDQDGRLVFYTAHFYRPGIMEVVNRDLDVYACSLRAVPPGLERAGLRAVRAFDVRGRFFHVEFLRAQRDDHDRRWIALEMNMRPPGGLMMDVFNFANDIDLYQQWANIVTYNFFTAKYSRPYHCSFVGRKRHRPYRHSHDEVVQACREVLVHHEPIPSIFARAMGEYAYVVRAPGLDEVQRAVDYILALR